MSHGHDYPAFTVSIEGDTGVVWCGSQRMFTAALPTVLLDHAAKGDDVVAEMVEYTQTRFGEFLHRRWITPGESSEDVRWRRVPGEET